MVYICINVLETLQVSFPCTLVFKLALLFSIKILQIYEVLKVMTITPKMEIWTNSGVGSISEMHGGVMCYGHTHCNKMAISGYGHDLPIIARKL